MLTQTQKLLLASSLLVANASGKCPFGFGSSEDKEKAEDHALPQLDDVVISSDGQKEVRRLLDGEIKYPSQIF